MITARRRCSWAAEDCVVAAAAIIVQTPVRNLRRSSIASWYAWRPGLQRLRRMIARVLAIAGRPLTIRLRMLHYYKFRQDLFSPAPAKDVYVKRPRGKGWPEECPPIRAANSFGFDLLANFDVTFTRKRDRSWRVTPDVIIPSDFDYAPSEESAGQPLTQQYAWF